MQRFSDSTGQLAVVTQVYAISKNVAEFAKNFVKIYCDLEVETLGEFRYRIGMCHFLHIRKTVCMGICLSEVKLLAAEAQERRFSGTVATLGRQHVYVTESEAKAIYQQYQLPQSVSKWELHRDPALAAKGYVLGLDSLLMGLGFERVVRIDVDNYEQVDEILDLNSASTPDHMVHAFDAIIDFGTLEHIYHVPNAMSHRSRGGLAPGG